MTIWDSRVTVPRYRRLIARLSSIPNIKSLELCHRITSNAVNLLSVGFRKITELEEQLKVVSSNRKSLEIAEQEVRT
jgi:predicted aldo/keto reductase-like oxidoreductase